MLGQPLPSPGDLLPTIEGDIAALMNTMVGTLEGDLAEMGNNLHGMA